MPSIDPAPRPDQPCTPVEQLAEFGGDSACWLARVCPDCGRITEGRDPDRCSSCGQALGTA